MNLWSVLNVWIAILLLHRPIQMSI